MAEIVEGWINLAYSENMRRKHPDINPSSPGHPYFTGVDGASPGQWVRIVMRTDEDQHFWCVGVLDRVEGPDRIEVVGIGYENGAPAPDGFQASRWEAQFVQLEDTNWYLTELGESG